MKKILGWSFLDLHDIFQPGLVILMYIIATILICQIIRHILLTLNKKDKSWLENLKPGTIGIPNWISIIRISLAIIATHLYIRHPFGEILSSRIATIIIAIAITTDMFDGHLARKLNQCTKAGKALDPLGDKFIFYPTAIAFLVVSNGNGYLSSPLNIIFYICFGFMVLRDLGFIVWFALRYSKLPNGISASFIDKIRMVTMCIWLGSATIAMSFVSTRDFLPIIGLSSIIVVAILSVVSVFVDLKRVKKLQQKSPHQTSRFTVIYY